MLGNGLSVAQCIDKDKTRINGAKASGEEQYRSLPKEGDWDPTTDGVDKSKKIAEDYFVGRGDRLAKIIFSAEYIQASNKITSYVDEDYKPLPTRTADRCQGYLAHRLEIAAINSYNALSRWHQHELAELDAQIEKARTAAVVVAGEVARLEEIRNRLVQLQKEERQGLRADFANKQAVYTEQMQAKLPAYLADDIHRRYVATGADITQYRDQKPSDHQLIIDIGSGGAGDATKLDAPHATDRLLPLPASADPSKRPQPIVYTRNENTLKTFNKKDGSWTHKIVVSPDGKRVRIIINPDRSVVSDKYFINFFGLRETPVDAIRRQAIQDVARIVRATKGMENADLQPNLSGYSQSERKTIAKEFEKAGAMVGVSVSTYNVLTQGEKVAARDKGEYAARKEIYTLDQSQANVPQEDNLKQPRVNQHAYAAFNDLQSLVSAIKQQELITDPKPNLGQWTDLQNQIELVNELLRLNNVEKKGGGLLQLEKFGKDIVVPNQPTWKEIADEFAKLNPLSEEGSKALKNILNSGDNPTVEQQDLVDALTILNKQLQRVIYGRELSEVSVCGGVDTLKALLLASPSDVINQFIHLDAADEERHAIISSMVEAIDGKFGRNHHKIEAILLALEDKINDPTKADSKVKLENIRNDFYNQLFKVAPKDATDFIEYCQKSAVCGDGKLIRPFVEQFILPVPDTEDAQKVRQAMLEGNQQLLINLILTYVTPEKYYKKALHADRSKHLKKMIDILLTQHPASSAQAHALQRILAGVGANSTRQDHCVALIVKHLQAMESNLNISDPGKKLDFLLRDINVIPTVEARLAIANKIKNISGLDAEVVRQLNAIIIDTTEVNGAPSKSRANKFLSQYHQAGASRQRKLQLQHVVSIADFSVYDKIKLAKILNGHRVYKNDGVKFESEDLVALRQELLTYVSAEMAAKIICYGKVDGASQGREIGTADGTTPNSRINDFSRLLEDTKDTSPQHAASVFWKIVAYKGDPRTDFSAGDGWKALAEFVITDERAELLEHILSHPKADLNHIVQLLDKLEPQRAMELIAKIVDGDGITVTGRAAGKQHYTRQAHIYSRLAKVDAKESIKHNLDLTRAMLNLPKDQLDVEYHQQHFERCARLALVEIGQWYDKFKREEEKIHFEASEHQEMPAGWIEEQHDLILTESSKRVLRYLVKVAENTNKEKRPEVYAELIRQIEETKFPSKIKQDIFTSDAVANAFGVTAKADVVITNAALGTEAKLAAMQRGLHTEENNPKKLTPHSRRLLLTRIKAIPSNTTEQKVAKYKLVIALMEKYSSDSKFAEELRKTHYDDEKRVRQESLFKDFQEAEILINTLAKEGEDYNKQLDKLNKSLTKDLEPAGSEPKDKVIARERVLRGFKAIAPYLLRVDSSDHELDTSATHGMNEEEFAKVVVKRLLKLKTGRLGRSSDAFDNVLRGCEEKNPRTGKNARKLGYGLRQFLVPSNTSDDITSDEFQNKLSIDKDHNPINFRATLRREILKSDKLSVEDKWQVIQNAKALNVRLHLLNKEVHPDHQVALFRKIYKAIDSDDAKKKKLRNYLNANGSEKLRERILASEDVSTEVKMQIIDSAGKKKYLDLLNQVKQDGENDQLDVFFELFVYQKSRLFSQSSNVVVKADARGNLTALAKYLNVNIYLRQRVLADSRFHYSDKGNFISDAGNATKQAKLLQYVNKQGDNNIAHVLISLFQISEDGFKATDEKVWHEHLKEGDNYKLVLKALVECTWDSFDEDDYAANIELIAKIVSTYDRSKSPFLYDANSYDTDETHRRCEVLLNTFLESETFTLNDRDDMLVNVTMLINVTKRLDVNAQVALISKVADEMDSFFTSEEESEFYQAYLLMLAKDTDNLIIKPGLSSRTYGVAGDTGTPGISPKAKFIALALTISDPSLKDVRYKVLDAINNDPAKIINSDITLFVTELGELSDVEQVAFLMNNNASGFALVQLLTQLPLDVMGASFDETKLSTRLCSAILKSEDISAAAKAKIIEHIWNDEDKRVYLLNQIPVEQHKENNRLNVYTSLSQVVRQSPEMHQYLNDNREERVLRRQILKSPSIVAAEKAHIIMNSDSDGNATASVEEQIKGLALVPEEEQLGVYQRLSQPGNVNAARGTNQMHIYLNKDVSREGRSTESTKKANKLRDRILKSEGLGIRSEEKMHIIQKKKGELLTNDAQLQIRLLKITKELEPTHIATILNQIIRNDVNRPLLDKNKMWSHLASVLHPAQCRQLIISLEDKQFAAKLFMQLFLSADHQQQRDLLNFATEVDDLHKELLQFPKLGMLDKVTLILNPPFINDEIRYKAFLLTHVNKSGANNVADVLIYLHLQRHFDVLSDPIWINHANIQEIFVSVIKALVEDSSIDSGSKQAQAELIASIILNNPDDIQRDNHINQLIAILTEGAESSASTRAEILFNVTKCLPEAHQQYVITRVFSAVQNADAKRLRDHYISLMVADQHSLQANPGMSMSDPVGVPGICLKNKLLVIRQTFQLAHLNLGAALYHALLQVNTHPSMANPNDQVIQQLVAEIIGVADQVRLLSNGDSQKRHTLRDFLAPSNWSFAAVDNSLRAKLRRGILASDEVSAEAKISIIENVTNLEQRFLLLGEVGGKAGKNDQEAICKLFLDKVHGEVEAALFKYLNVVNIGLRNKILDDFSVSSDEKARIIFLAGHEIYATCFNQINDVHKLDVLEMLLSYIERVQDGSKENKFTALFEYLNSDLGEFLREQALKSRNVSPEIQAGIILSADSANYGKLLNDVHSNKQLTVCKILYSRIASEASGPARNNKLNQLRIYLQSPQNSSLKRSIVTELLQQELSVGQQRTLSAEIAELIKNEDSAEQQINLLRLAEDLPMVQVADILMSCPGNLNDLKAQNVWVTPLAAFSQPKRLALINRWIASADIRGRKNGLIADLISMQSDSYHMGVARRLPMYTSRLFAEIAHIHNRGGDQLVKDVIKLLPYVQQQYLIEHGFSENAGLNFLIRTTFILDIADMDAARQNNFALHKKAFDKLATYEKRVILERLITSGNNPELLTMLVKKVNSLDYGPELTLSGFFMMNQSIDALDMFNALSYDGQAYIIEHGIRNEPKKSEEIRQAVFEEGIIRLDDEELHSVDGGKEVANPALEKIRAIRDSAFKRLPPETRQTDGNVAAYFWHTDNFNRLKGLGDVFGINLVDESRGFNEVVFDNVVNSAVAEENRPDLKRAAANDEVIVYLQEMYHSCPKDEQFENRLKFDRGELEHIYQLIEKEPPGFWVRAKDRLHTAVIGGSRKEGHLYGVVNSNSDEESENPLYEDEAYEEEEFVLDDEGKMQVSLIIGMGMYEPVDSPKREDDLTDDEDEFDDIHLDGDDDHHSPKK